MSEVCEFSCPLIDLHEKTLDLSYLTAKRLRFIDVDAFLSKKQLRIISLPSLIARKYATISYPWLDLQLDLATPVETSASQSSLGHFFVKGGEIGGLISSDVLMTCCRAVKQLADRECRLLWLDRICIKQADRQDKGWQIKNMHDIYKMCDVCFALPGGIQRLAQMDEPTTWLKRAWTLQEALVSKKVKCLFRWL